MLDTYVAQLILSSQKIAYIITDDALSVSHVGGNISFLGTTVEIDLLPLVEMFPELVGYEEQLASILQGKLPMLQLNLINRETSQGSVSYVNIKLYPHCPSPDGTIAGLLLIFEDMTLVGEAQQRLTQQHNELYLLHQQLQKANLQLAAANAELRGLDELKSRFVSIAAHELRTPIASLIGYVNFLLDDTVDPLSQGQRSSVGVIGRSARRLLTITSDLLDVTRLEAGRLEMILESVNLRTLIGAVILEFQPQIDEKQLVVDLRTSATSPSVTFHSSKEKQDLASSGTIPPVLCDEKRTIQIMSNLLSNAIKYTPQGGAVTVSLTTDLTEGIAMVQIIDTGIGIPAADLRQLGKAFFRAGNVYKARTNGTGLGLHITQSLLELQGGTFQIESTEGAGTTVTVTFPLDDGLLTTPISNTTSS
ncbi:MAG: HAMP domain-containing histidine kinase [Caldilineaceae bacterium]|nr:HAMP domain-containing histidine kinase [Caldilineaceae bacterium]